MGCACVTGSKMMMKSFGSCSDMVAFSPDESSIVSKVTSLASVANDSLLKSTPELQNTCLKYSHTGSVSGSCAAMRRTREFTVKETST
ncbi:hypothetical protein ACVWW5_000036 [Bradyrhizobium sp. LM3.4]